MSRGAIAKQAVEDKIREAFGKDFVGVDPSTKKIYVQAEEDGQMVQGTSAHMPQDTFLSRW